MLPIFFPILVELYRLNNLHKEINPIKSYHKDKYKRLCILIANEEYECAAFIITEEVFLLMDKLYPKYSDDKTIVDYYTNYKQLLELLNKHF